MLLCFVCLSGVSWLLCGLPRGVMGLSAVCDCGSSWIYALTIFHLYVCPRLNYLLRSISHEVVRYLPQFCRVISQSYWYHTTIRKTVNLYGPRREKTCLRGIREIEFQTSLVSCRYQLEDWNFTSSKFTYDTFQKANNKGADQTARMRRLVCACVVRKPPKTGFLASRPVYLQIYV